MRLFCRSAMIEFLISKLPVAYPQSIKIMEERVQSILSGTGRELIWLLEHPPILTAGTSFKEEDLLTDNLPVFQTNRGGKHTLHAPGQRVCYLILNLKERAGGKVPDVRKYVLDLENIIINALAAFGIKGEVKEGRVGVWVTNPNTKKEEKIAAIGIRLTRGITMHGFAINISNDLSLFDNIVPCGISDFGVSSLHSLGVKVGMEEFDKILLKEISLKFS